MTNKQPSTKYKNSTSSLPGEDQIQEWLIGKVAELTGRDPDMVDSRQPFAYWGLDSIAMVSISGELEDWVGRRLSPTLLYDYPNIDALARYLSEDHRA